ncbi:uncharacterized protein K452DRAFT_321556, partial [Aplosporella prunicola CBS 121167]
MMWLSLIHALARRCPSSARRLCSRSINQSPPVMKSRCSALLLLLLLLLAFVEVEATALGPRATSIPPPLDVAYSQYWDGYDGPWSSFTIRLGSRDTKVRVFPSTSSTALWAVSPLGCLEGTYRPGIPCNASGDTFAPGSRGGIFHYEASSSWHNNPLSTPPDWALHALTQPDYESSAPWGYDTVSIGASGGPTLTNQTIAVIASKWFWLGVLPLNPRPTNFSVNDTYYLAPSLLQVLKDEGHIPSLSWGYTAGASYDTENGVFGSLTLGGYDAGRFSENGSRITVPFQQDEEKDLTVSVKSIKVSGSSSISLSSEPFDATIDSALSYLFLPQNDIWLWEKAFDLTLDPVSNLYLLNETAYTKLRNEQQTISITLGAPGDSDNRNEVTIQYPIESFLLNTSWPNNITNSNGSSRYFPIQVTEGTAACTLGRTFLQEAYLIYDYENQEFTVGARSPGNPKPDLKLISPREISPSGPTQGDNSGKSGLSAGALAGAIVGSIIGGFLIAALVFWIYTRKRAAAKKSRPLSVSTGSTTPRPRAGSRINSFFRNPFTKGPEEIVPGMNELPQDPSAPTPAQAALEAINREHKRHLSEELEGSTNIIHEMFQPKPKLAEMEGDAPLGYISPHARSSSAGSQDDIADTNARMKYIYEMEGSLTSSADHTPLPSPKVPAYPSPNGLDAVARRQQEDAEADPTNSDDVDAARRRGSLRSLGSPAHSPLERRVSDWSQTSNTRSQNGPLADILEERNGDNVNYSRLTEDARGDTNDSEPTQETSGDINDDAQSTHENHGDTIDTQSAEERRGDANDGTRPTEEGHEGTASDARVVEETHKDTDHDVRPNSKSEKDEDKGTT